MVVSGECQRGDIGGGISLQSSQFLSTFLSYLFLFNDRTSKRTMEPNPLAFGREAGLLVEC